MTSEWPAMKASRLLAALLRTGWSIERQRGSHRRLTRAGFPAMTFAFHDGDEIGPRMVAKLAKDGGLRREDL